MDCTSQRVHTKGILNFNSGLLITVRKKTLKDVHLPELSQSTATSWLPLYASGTGADGMYATGQTARRSRPSLTNAACSVVGEEGSIVA